MVGAREPMGYHYMGSGTMPVFSEAIDRKLLSMKDEEGERVYKLVDGLNIDDIIWDDRSRELESAFLRAIEDSSINLNQPMIAHPKSGDEPFDFTATYMCKDFYLAASYYSAGSSLASACIFRFPEGRYFNRKMEFPEDMQEVFNGENKQDISLF